MIRVLHIVGSMHPGGMENFIMNLYRNIDRDKIQFDFVVHMKLENDYTRQIREMGGRIYELPRLTSKPFANLRKLYKLVKEKQYKVVVRHTPNALIAPQIYAARWAGATVICHSHNTTDPQKLMHKIGRVMLKLGKVEYFACSQEAGKWMFGKNKKFRVVHNAIDIEAYSYHVSGRERIRKEFSLDDCHVYGHVANFIESKNHSFLLKVYKDISKLDEAARFLCIGGGKLREQIEKEAEALGIHDKVIFTGVRYDVADFMSCMDVLVFPSLFEGLPLTLIEAQAAGLPCLVSDTITRDVKVTDGLVYFYSLNSSSSEWAKKAYDLALQADSDHSGRTCQRENIAKAGYDIEKLKEWYETYFMECANR